MPNTMFVTYKSGDSGKFTVPDGCNIVQSIMSRKDPTSGEILDTAIWFDKDGIQVWVDLYEVRSCYLVDVSDMGGAQIIDSRDSDEVADELVAVFDATEIETGEITTDDGFST